MATSAREWKKPQNHELTLPSGNVCLVKRPGMEKLLSAGILPDSLTPIAMEAIKKAQSGPQDHKKKGEDASGLDPEMMGKFLEKEGALEDIFDSFDKVTALCVVSPEVKYHRRQRFNEAGNPIKDVNGRDKWEDIPLGERDGECLYTDDVDSEDKQFIFQFVSGGSPDLERFRDSGDDVAAPQSGTDVSVSAVGTSGSDEHA